MRYVFLILLFGLTGCAAQNKCLCAQFVLDAKYTFDHYNECQVCAPLFQSAYYAKTRQEMLQQQKDLIQP